MSAIPADIIRPVSEWRRAAVALVLVLVAVLTLYRETAAAMVGIWSRSDTFAHAFLVPPISFWLIWRVRHRWLALHPTPQPWLLVPIALAAFAWLLGDLVSVNAATQFALVAMCVLCVPAMLGLAVTREILFPLAFLFFCVPFGEFLLPTLMEATADFTIAALRLTGIPVYREGLQFVIPSGHWSVVEACSGVRYLIASFMVGSLFGYLNFATTKKRLVFLAASLVIPIVANWLRAYMIVMIGHLSNNTLAVGVDHLIYGWVFFGIVITAMFFVGSRWADDSAAFEAAEAPRSAAPQPAGAAATLLVAALVVVLTLAPVALVGQLDQRDARVPPPVLTLPESLAGGASAVPEQEPEWRPHFVGAATEARRTYSFRGHAVGVHVLYYRAQSNERELVSSQNVVVMSNDHSWNRVAGSTRSIVVDGRTIAFADAELAGAASPGAPVGTAMRVWQLYWVDGRLTASEPWAKVLGAVSRLAGRGDDGAAIFLSVRGDPQTVGGPVLEAFAAANLGLLTQRLQVTRDAR